MNLPALVPRVVARLELPAAIADVALSLLSARTVPLLRIDHEARGAGKLSVEVNSSIMRYTLLLIARSATHIDHHHHRCQNALPSGRE